MLSLLPVGRAQEAPAYSNRNLPAEQRVVALLSRMTLGEKVGQLVGTWQNRQPTSEPQLLFVDEKGDLQRDRAGPLGSRMVWEE